jgi:hypothetical protein
MPSNIKEFSTYTIESPLIALGEFTDSKGRLLKITPEVAKGIYESLNAAAPLKDVHIDGKAIGSIQKYILKPDGIHQKTLITDPERFLERYRDGHVFISPEITIETTENNQVVSATLDGAALTNNPGMIKDMAKIEHFHFEGTTPPTTDASNGWQEPLGELKSTINTLNSTLSTFGEQVKNMNSQSTPAVEPPKTEPEQPKVESSDGKMTLSVDDLAKLVNDAVENRLKSLNPTPSVPEASETPVKPTDDEVAKKYAEMLNQLENLKGSQEKSLKKQLNSIMGELKAVGIEHPEKMIPEGLTTDQQITILESIKENFAKNSPMSAPLQEPISGQFSSQHKNDTIDDILASEEFQSPNNPTLRNMFMNLANPDLMRRYNMNTLFDQNGVWTGPKV